MGKNSSKPISTEQPTPVVNYNPTYEVIKTINHELYGEVKLIKEKDTNKEMILKEIAVNTKSAYEAELHICKERAALYNNNIVHVIGYNSEEKKSYCANMFKISLFIENLEVTLAKKVKEAKKANTVFSESEILLIAENMISCLSFFQNKGVNHGDITLAHIFVTPEAYKLSDPTLTKEKGWFTSEKKEEFTAPEMMKGYQTKDKEVVHDKFKADVFSLGISLLSVATLTKTKEFYDAKKGMINDALLNEKLEVVKNNFTPFTYELIRDMLNMNHQGRPDFVNLETRLSPYKVNIRSRTPIFTVKTVEVNFDDDILKKVAMQIARSQELRATIEKTI